LLADKVVLALLVGLTLHGVGREIENASAPIGILVSQQNENDANRKQRSPD
jgi:hypothetical protein